MHVDKEPIDQALTMRVFPALLGVTLMSLITSGVQPEYLTTFGVLQAQIIQAGYGLLLVVMAVFPNINPFLHRVGGSLAILIFVGKAIGFAELVIDGNYNLIGPVGERLVLAVSAFIWHKARTRRVTLNGHTSS